MPLSFLAPLFLLGLAALAVPIVIHLTDRERREVVRFPSLMFVQRIPHRTVRRQRIRHWWLFLVRSAAVALLVMAFARPLLDRAGVAGVAVGGSREVVLLLDRSHSMAYGDRWARALAAARSALDDLGPGDRVTVAVFSDRAEALTATGSDPAAARAVLNGIAPEDGATRYGPAIQLAGQVLEGSERPRREVVLITDFQRSGWDPSEVRRLPAGTTVTPVDVGGAAPASVAITDAVTELAGEEGDRLAVAARLANTGREPVRALRVTLELDGQRVETRAVDVAAHGSATVRFAPAPLPRRAVLGRVTAAMDAPAVDDAFHFVLSPRQTVSVLVVEDPGATKVETLYLRRALEIGNDPRFRVVRRTPAQVEAGDLAGRPAVIVNDLARLPAAMTRRLTDHVQAGGRALVVLGRRAAGSPQALAPIAAGAPVDRLEGRGGTLAVAAYEHPVFEAFRAPRSGDFSSARFFRYWLLSPPESAAVLARFDDGAPALVELPLGAGSVLVLATSLDNAWSDLALRPVFLPFVHRLARHLAGYQAPRRWVRVGQAVDLVAHLPQEPGAAPLREVVVEDPAGQRTLRGLEAPDGRFLEARRRGYYRVRSLADRGAVLSAIAVNVDPVEADLTPMDPAELVGAMTPNAGPVADPARTVTLTARERERRQGLWWYLLVTVLLLLVAESILSNRPRRARA
jgi:hypothetical protein